MELNPTRYADLAEANLSMVDRFQTPNYIVSTVVVSSNTTNCYYYI